MTVDAASGADREQQAMRQAMTLAESVRGRTSPNPPVGAVVLDAAGIVVGSGATQPVGGPHAERVALDEAGPAARGGTLLVTLEPCAHTGRTPPCVDAVLAAGVARVVYAVSDPNPLAAGGDARLRRAGLDVHAGLEADEAARGALRAWLHSVATGRPFVTWKFASTMDGRVAALDGTSQWISSSISRHDSHRLRAVVDAIMVGSGTVLADDPQLSARLDDGELAQHQPLRVVLDRRHRLPQYARVFDDAAETVVLDTAVPRFALKALHDRGVRHVLLEGGPTLAGAFVEARCIDEVIAYIAPKLLGAGPAALADAGIATISQALALEVEDVSRLGPDIRVTARPVWPEHLEHSEREQSEREHLELVTQPEDGGE
jgi:diaminohydroxyphosphoribosylaminopyrimidine deaminase/5-amino-6-(5-phosphoribosylamino)uracil reductase